jgi:excisionase family DNA binding protein
MKSLLAFFISVFVLNSLNAQLWSLQVKDATTGAVMRDKGVVVTVSYQSIIVNVLHETFNVRNNHRYTVGNSNYRFQANPDVISFTPEMYDIPIQPNIDLNQETQVTYFLGDENDQIYSKNIVSVTAHVQVVAANYNPVELNIVYPSNQTDIEIKMVPQNLNVKLDGNVNVNGNVKSEEKSKITDIYTPSDIASALKISEQDVINLIKTNKLKAKLIGDKYFIRKEDFDAFMKQ